jgi:quercetin dioxygenase-like cupin family protein
MSRAGILAIVFASLAGCASIAAESPAPILPDRAKWASPPNLPGVQGAWLLGSADKPGVYLFRVRMEKGARIPPHTHPDERSTTVLAGTLWVGFGERFEEARLVAVPAGAIYVAPAGLPHYLWARDGAVEYQESGIAPSGTTFAAPDRG